MLLALSSQPSEGSQALAGKLITWGALHQVGLRRAQESAFQQAPR